MQHQRLEPDDRPSGKLCFMELVEAVAAKLPQCLAVGDSIDTTTWGQFVAMDKYSICWLNDNSSYFLNVCGSSWDKAVSL